MSYSKKFDKVIETLNTKGLGKEASDVSQVKDAVFNALPLSRAFERTPRQPHMPFPDVSHSPTDPNVKVPFAKRGEPVITLDPVSGKEKITLWGMDKPQTREELLTGIKTGVLTAERLTDQYSKGDASVKKFLAPLIEQTNNQGEISSPLGQGLDRRNVLRSKLASISESLDKLGYTLLVSKLASAVNEYDKVANETDEMHSIPSIEKVYEKSDSATAFRGNIKKLIGIHENILLIVKNFEKEESEIMDKVHSEELSEEGAVEKIIALVTKSDKASNAEISKLKS